MTEHISKQYDQDLEAIMGRWEERKTPVRMQPVERH